MALSCFARPAGCPGRLRYLGGVMLEDLVGVHGFRSYYYCRYCERPYVLEWTEVDGSLSIRTMDDADIREAMGHEAAHWKKGAIRLLSSLLAD